ncbi:hypothetical protein GCM10010327_32700 [Streptomyces nitrosporeus]|nr:hypothetical protein GCM10010327_32700 [Streptomyces nitrosporeus]
MAHQVPAAMAPPAFCGVPEWLLGEPVTELAARWEAHCEFGRHDRRQGTRRREAGAGPKYGRVVTGRLLAAPVPVPGPRGVRAVVFGGEMAES